MYPVSTCVKSASAQRAKFYSSQEIAAHIDAERLAGNSDAPKRTKSDLRYLGWLGEKEREEYQRVNPPPRTLEEVLQGLERVEDVQPEGVEIWLKGEEPEAPPAEAIACDLDRIAEIIEILPSYRSQLIKKCYKQAGMDGDPYGLLSSLDNELLVHSLTALSFDCCEEAWKWDGNGWALIRKHPNAPILLKALERHTAALFEHVQNLALMRLDEEGIRERAKELVNERLGRLAFAATVTRATRPEAFAEQEGDLLQGPRYICEAAQRRRIRSERHRVDGHVSWILGLTGGNQLFVSNATFRGWEQRQEHAREWAADKVIATPEGEYVASLADVMASSKSARRATLIALTLGLTEKAKRLDLAPVFVTLTLPPEYHPNPKKGRCSYNPAISPKDAFREMQSRWQRVRALFSKRQVDFFGIWTAEPHEDGCPHRHALIWIPIEQLEALKTAIQKHFPGERATEIRVLKGDDEASAKVSSYVLTYVLKATDVAGESHEEADEDHLANFPRVRSWASANAARRFGFIGLPRGLIGTWKGIYNMSDEAVEDPRVRLIQKRMRKRQYASALTLLGAFEKVNADQQRFQPVYRERQTKYGDEYRQKIGVRNVFTDTLSVWKTRDYVITSIDECQKVSFVVSSPSEGAGAPSDPPKNHGKPPGKPPDGGIWHTESDGTSYKIDPQTGEIL